MHISEHRRFIVWTTLTVVVFLTGVILFNRAVNPFCVFSSDWLASPLKPETFTHLRLVKAAQVRHLQPATVLLGTSRVETGLFPGHPSLSQRPVYNLGLSQACTYETLRYFQHASAGGQLRMAVWLMDYAAFLESSVPSPDFSESRLALSVTGEPNRFSFMMDWVQSLLTENAVAGSFRTLLKSKGEKSYAVDGSRIASVERARVLQKGGSLPAFLSYERHQFPFQVKQPAVISEAALGHLRQLLELARERHVEVRLGISPLHARHLELLQIAGHGPAYKEWRRRVVALVEPLVATHAMKPIVDFSGYNEYTTEAVPQSGLARWYYESSHFTMELGDLVLSRLLAPDLDLKNVPGQFGSALSLASLPTHEGTIEIARQAYLSERIAEITQLHEMTRPFLPPMTIK